MNNSITSLAGHNLTATTLVNNATLRLQGNEAVTLTNGNDTAEGLWEYVGDGAGGVASFTIKDWGATDYYNLKINPTDTTETYNVSSPLKLNGSLTHLGGTLNLAANVTTVGGTITSNGPVTLSTTVTVDTTNGGGTPGGANMTFTNTINGAQDLALTAGSGAISLQGTVGGTTPLTSFTVNSANTLSLPVTTINGPCIDHATTTTLNGNLTETFTSITGEVLLATGPITVNAVGDDMFIAGANFDGAHALTLQAGGDIHMSLSVVGGTTPLSSLTVSAPSGGIDLGSVTTTGAQSYTSLGGTYVQCQSEFQHRGRDYGHRPSKPGQRDRGADGGLGGHRRYHL